ncbi:TIGR03557 family F420-dependent LLM class oxidoreductase [Streptomyces sp. ACA25]|uniref:TIGR03557 family F420-dependent LLM class oxidoreductase n=1 Tax=Streptomyces sp. ACA25 TaxID=3022596 RepID=UPI002307522B|nr:TIGR03557 family F420-dependent LLM class oxidoreductase [Streptomyces sp. ACA25]MDB1086612.1 TIGR03557 family F420-dependent LLM class oxidoreductase [Streptomyces sp. ACA25]
MATAYGYFLASEDYGPQELVEQARMAEESGFTSLWISDHYHPWIEEQGHSPFVWSVIGALSASVTLPVETAVTCPTVRIHPAVIAQAVATSAVQLNGRFRFGVGTGEALNEHILGDHWPRAAIRQEMLEEAVDIIRRLLTGKRISHRGRHYTVENARLYTVPDEPVPIDISAFAPAATDLAARIGDGFLTMGPESDLVEQFRAAGGGDKPAVTGVKVCYEPDRDAAVRTVLRRWPNLMLPGELAAMLPEPQHFEQACRMVTEQHVLDSPIIVGNDPDEYAEALSVYSEAGFDRVHINQIGADQRGFFDFFRSEVLPRLNR